MYSDDCTQVLDWLANAQPEVAALCLVKSGAYAPDETKLRLREKWVPRLTDLKRDPDARARAAVGRALGCITLTDGTPLDNRPGVGFVVRDGVRIPDIAWSEEVPAGKYSINKDKRLKGTEYELVTVQYPYRLACYPITNAQFDCFVTALDFADSRWWCGLPDREREIDDTYFLPYSNSPRETVSWYQAVAFCRWLSDKLSYTVELPHEYEWELAARWPDGRFYPWGNEFDAARANMREGNNVGKPTSVGLYPHGANAKLNLYDLSGNVWEWCWNEYYKGGNQRVLRGGSWDSYFSGTRTTARFRDVPGARGNDYGFRVVVRRAARDGLLSQ